MSGISMNVRGDIKGVTKHLSKLERKIVPGAVVSSLTGTAREIRKLGLAWGKNRFAVPPRELSKRSKIRRAQRNNWTARISLNYRGMNPAKAFPGASQTKTGVKAGRHSFPGAFLLSGSYSSKYVGRRQGKKRKPVQSELIQLQQLEQRFRRLTLTRSGRIFKKLFNERLKKALKKRGFVATSERI